MFCLSCTVSVVLQVIYQLCACPDTSGPTMRYLRTSQDFLFSHLQHLPFVLTGEFRQPAETIATFTAVKHEARSDDWSAPWCQEADAKFCFWMDK